MTENELKSLERNRFFYGKLLTAEDFIAEQNYFNTKIRLLNRLLFGSGVVAGLNVIKADERSVAIDGGVALDGAGREIIVPEPMIVRISELDGYEAFARENSDRVRAYLCIEYDEKRTQPIHSIALSALDDENDGPEHNRIAEGFSLYITAEEPEDIPSEAEARALVRRTVVSDTIDVSVTLPAVVRAGEEFVLETAVDAGSGGAEIELEFELTLEALSAEDGSAAVRVEYRGAAERGSVFTRLRADRSFANRGVIRIENARAFRDKVPLAARAVCAETEIVGGGALAVTEGLKRRSAARRTGLYLARLELYVSPQYYILESVASLPFSQSVPTAAELRSFQIRSEFTRASRADIAEKAAPKPAAGPLVNSGSVTVEIPDKAKRGQTFRSAEIPHGLGTGTVFVTAGTADGSSVVFEGVPILNGDFCCGTSVDRDAGLFSVSVRLNRDLDRRTLELCWFAVKTPDKTARGELEIYPSVYYARRYETVRFSVSHPDGGVWRSRELRWSVTPDDGGAITPEGVFTAFDKAGFYEIAVSCAADPSLTATAFLVVK